MAENVGNFLLSLPTGHESAEFTKVKKIFLTLSAGHEKCDWSPIFENSFPLLLFGDERCVLTKKFIFLYEISAALVYMGEMSTPTTHWR